MLSIPVRTQTVFSAWFKLFLRESNTKTEKKEPIIYDKNDNDECKDDYKDKDKNENTDT